MITDLVWIRSDILSKSNFKGRIYFSNALNVLASCNTEVAKLKESFKEFWKTGYSPNLGKDIAFGRPTEILSLSVRHVHVDTGEYSNSYGVSSTEACWVSWRQGEGKRLPASDSFLIYSVNTQRDAYLIAYLDSDAHNAAEISEYMQRIIEMAEDFYAQTKTKPMPLSEHYKLYDDEWLDPGP